MCAKIVKKSDYDVFEGKIECTAWIQSSLTYWNRRDTGKPHSGCTYFVFVYLQNWILLQSLSETLLAGTDMSRMITAWLLIQVFTSALLSQTAKLSHLLAWHFFWAFSTSVYKLFFFVFHFFLQNFVAAAFCNSDHFTKPQPRAVCLLKH